MPEPNLTRRRISAMLAPRRDRQFCPPGGPFGPACRGLARIGTRRESLDRDLRSGSGRGGAACRALWPGRAAARAAVQPLPDRLGDLNLNRTGILVAPDAEMVALLKASLRYAGMTEGAFDPTVQPLWDLYTDHFSSEKPDPDGPSPRKLAEALARWGTAVCLSATDRVALARRGAAVTLNGIAQGYATDRIVERLRKAGLSTTLVDMGEIRAIGARPEATPGEWASPIRRGPAGALRLLTLSIVAVETSGGAGNPLDPRPVRASVRSRDWPSPSRYRRVSVVAQAPPKPTRCRQHSA